MTPLMKFQIVSVRTWSFIHFILPHIYLQTRHNLTQTFRKIETERRCCVFLPVICVQWSVFELWGIRHYTWTMDFMNMWVNCKWEELPQYNSSANQYLLKPSRYYAPYSTGKECVGWVFLCIWGKQPLSVLKGSGCVFLFANLCGSNVPMRIMSFINVYRNDSKDAC